MNTCFCVLARTIVGLGLTALQGHAQSAYEPYTFTTIAGKAGSHVSVDGTNSAARFNAPAGMAVDSAGNLFVPDINDDTIRKVMPVGTNWVVTTLAGKAGSRGSADGTGSAARFAGPGSVAVDSAGNVFVPDIGNHTIRKVTPAGEVMTLAGKAGSQGSADGMESDARFYYPDAVALDSAGNVYVADDYNYTIRKVTPVGTNWVVTTLAGKAGSPGSVDGTGSAARFSYVLGLAVDSAGNVYVADLSNTIRKVTPVGTNWVVTTLAGKAGIQGSADGTGSAVRFNGPMDVAVDSAGNLFVPDGNNNTIRKVAPLGTNWVVTTLAGKAGSPGSVDGTGSAVRFGFSSGSGNGYVAVDSAGNLYVADCNYGTIRKGYPAFAIISSGPSFGFNGGQFRFDLMGGSAGQSVVVEASTDLVSWLPLWTNTLASPLNFSDPEIGVHTNRFYRALTR